MQDKDLKNPLASPYYGDCTGFQPVFLGVSTEESLFDDSIKMYEKLLKEGGDSTLKVWEGMWHTFYMMDFPESNVVFEQFSQFMEGLAKASPVSKTKAKGAAHSKQDTSFSK